MYYLFMDTETTGTPKNYKAPMFDVNNWPRLVQLGWIVMKNGEIIEEDELVIIPDGFQIPLEASSVHGITTEKAIACGEPIGRVIENFPSRLSLADAIIGHNIDFDINVIGAEFIRQGRGNPFIGKTVIDTMKASTDFCQIPGPYGNKWPKLTELWLKLFGTELPQTHTALDDIKNTATCFFELEKRGIIKVTA